MILNSAPTNEAVLSNVGTITDFTIKATAKSFKILSDSLYANKVRAVIRELACNALDSHIAAGNAEPFAVHLPSQLEPFFSVRDYGVGLDHTEVTNIFTSFFTSTKTESNQFIGALGLGSKSPFSYTDNFTIIAIKDGRRGVYTAFINEHGFPSIALMMEEATQESPGVEIKFSVIDRYDFGKFREEARHVFKFWKNRPEVILSGGFTFSDPEYLESDIVPGVHHTDYRSSYAVMGNIAYPIDIPEDGHGTDDKLHRLLKCGLVIEFNIGELDFQASREGLSYIPLTVNSIEKRLIQLRDKLGVHIAEQANAITNEWKRAYFLASKYGDDLWSAAVTKYVADTGFTLFSPGAPRWSMHQVFTLAPAKLESDLNIQIRAFIRHRGQVSMSTAKPVNEYDQTTNRYETIWKVPVSADRFFVFNDTKTGATERAKFHWRNRTMSHYSETVYVIEPVDRTKPMKRQEFLDLLSCPPDDQVMNASTLMVKDRDSGIGKNVTIMRLEARRHRRWSTSVREMVWVDAGKSDAFDSSVTYYYLPLSGYQALGATTDVKELSRHLESSKIYQGTIYGVRKNDLEWVKKQPNWIDLDTMVRDRLVTQGSDKMMSVVKEAIGWSSVYSWNGIASLDDASPYKQLWKEFKDTKDIDDSDLRRSMEYLFQLYKTDSVTDPTALITKYCHSIAAILSRYPLLNSLNRYAENTAVMEYIRLIDAARPVENT